MAAAISSHNKKQLETRTPDRPCNCQVKDKCPLDGKCQATEVVYRASISDGATTEFYIGLSEPPFKSKYANLQTSLRHEKYRHSTELSKHVWALKDKNVDTNIKWEILDRAKSYSNTAKRCSLCLAEKLRIITADKDKSLN